MKKVLIFTALATALFHIPDFLAFQTAQAQSQPQKMQIPMHGNNPNTERLSGEPAANTRISKSAPGAELRKALNTKVKITPTKKIKLKKDQYSFDKDDKITIFSAQMYSDFKLSEHCFKNSKSLKPVCEAWDASHKKINEDDIKLKSPEMNNKAAIYCDLIGGQNVIVKTYQNSESDFCLFKDGSLVSSWSAYDNRKLSK